MGAATLPSAESWEIPEVPADSSFVDGVASRDVRLDAQEQSPSQSQEVWVRLYLPESAVEASKLPIVLHVHGGGFVRFSAATSSYHHFCKKVATDATALVVSLNHRLAPAFRLPAAYQDLRAALKWLQAQAAAIAVDHHQQQESCDPWLARFADFSRVILMGGSSGGNIVHNALLEEAEAMALAPLGVAAQILLQPFFGGAARTPSELRLAQGPILTLPMSDQLWSLALPDGATREHPFCDPTRAPSPPPSPSPSPSPCKLLPRALVIVGGRDLLRDRQVEFAAWLRRRAAAVALVEYPDATHGFVTPDGTVSYVFMPEVLRFIHSVRDS